MRFARLILLALAALVAGLSAQTTRLKLGITILGDLSEGQTRSYSIKLKANQYLRATVTQAVAGVVIELDAPDGKKIVEVDTRKSAWKPSVNLCKDSAKRIGTLYREVKDHEREADTLSAVGVVRQTWPLWAVSPHVQGPG